MSETPTSAPPEDAQAQEQTFTQADVDRIVRERVAREKAKYADYDDLKQQAAGAKTVEQQLDELRAETTKAQRDALAARIAAKHQLSPEDADLFLTGADEDTLNAQAQRLAARETGSRKSGNYVPNEGVTPKNHATDELRTFTRQLFGRAQD